MLRPSSSIPLFRQRIWRKYFESFQKKTIAKRHKSSACSLQDGTIIEEYDPFIDKPMEIVRDVSEEIRASVRNYTETNELNLVAITASRRYDEDGKCTDVDHGSDTYSEWISKTCEHDGINYETWRVAGGLDNTSQQVQSLIERANDFNHVHGLLVYYPLYNKPYILGMKDGEWSASTQQDRINAGYENTLQEIRRKCQGLTYKTKDDYFRDLVHPSKDVEGLCHSYHSRKQFRNQALYVDKYDGISDNETDYFQNDTIFPCTALSVVRILKRCLNEKQFDPSKPIGRRMEGTTFTIINRSQILGRPLASLLANDGATVYSVDESTIIKISHGNMLNRCSKVNDSVQKCIEDSSVIISGVPCSDFKVPTSWIQRNSTFINVASEPNVDEDSLRKVEGVQYVSAVGKVTVALLEHNLVELHNKFHNLQ